MIEQTVPTMRNLKSLIALAAIMIGLFFGTPCRAEESPASDERKVAESYNKTALKLFGELKKDSGNLVISPLSIGIAMSMSLTGARGATEAEMARVLNQRLPRERMDSACSSILDKLNSFRKESGIALSVANALCLTPYGFVVHPSYKELLNTRYSAEIFRAKDVAPINEWVAKKTRGKIDRILEKLSENSACVLLNAVYFKGPWASQFDAKLTRPGGFYLTENKTVSVPMMHKTAEYPVSTYDDFTALAIPYRDKSLAMIIILPKARTGLDGVEAGLTSEKIHSILLDLKKRQSPEDFGTFQRTKVSLTLPRFKVRFGSDLIRLFEALGMTQAFSAKADFGGITGRKNDLGLIRISQIQHKTFLEVNEEGSEAAASTAVEFEARSSSRITNFEADHPFVFLLVDKTTGAILFMGRVTNPLKDEVPPPSVDYHLEMTQDYQID